MKKRCKFTIRYSGVDVSGKGRIVETGTKFENVYIIEVDPKSLPNIVNDYYGTRIAVRKEDVKIL